MTTDPKVGSITYAPDYGLQRHTGRYIEGLGYETYASIILPADAIEVLYQVFKSRLLRETTMEEWPG